MSDAPGPPSEPEEVEEQEAVQVPGPEDISLISAAPTGTLHGDEDTTERAGKTQA